VRLLRPKKPGWFVASLAIGLASLLVAAGFAHWRPWEPGRRAGLAFGAAAAVLFLLDLLYPLRRRLLSFPFGSAQRWIQLHIYGGILACLFVLIHEGFRWPSGTMGWLLLLLSFWSAVSGLVGVWLQKWVPAMMASGLSVEALLERIPELVEKLRGEAATLLQGSSEMLERFYREDIEPALAEVQTSWEYLVDVRSGRERRLEPFVRLTPFLAEEERPRLEELKVIFTEKLELDAQYSLQRILRGWVVLHVPPSVLLFGLMLFHIWTGLSYQ
jgi:hypothetical protein